jgi:hypothetical protein
MTKTELFEGLKTLQAEQQIQWMLRLGGYLTISARGFYSSNSQPGNISRLMGFNEIQHRVYGRIRDLNGGNEWTLDSFLDGIIETSNFYEINGDVGWALKKALPEVT